jgi:hydroxymethylglutaryl-CoA lyase
MTERSVTLVEVGPRDGFRSIATFIPTATKFELIERAARTGLREIEIGSCVSRRVVPDMEDTPEILALCKAFETNSLCGLMPDACYAERALDADARQLVFVFFGQRGAQTESRAAHHRAID